MVGIVYWLVVGFLSLFVLYDVSPYWLLIPVALVLLGASWMRSSTWTGSVRR